MNSSSANDFSTGLGTYRFLQSDISDKVTTTHWQTLQATFKMQTRQLHSLREMNTGKSANIPTEGIRLLRMYMYAGTKFINMGVKNISGLCIFLLL